MTATELCFSSRVVTSLLENPCLRGTVPPTPVHMVRLEAPKGLRKFFPRTRMFHLQNASHLKGTTAAKFHFKSGALHRIQAVSALSSSCLCSHAVLSATGAFEGGTVLADLLLSALREHPAGRLGVLRSGHGDTRDKWPLLSSPRGFRVSPRMGVINMAVTQ